MEHEAANLLLVLVLAPLIHGRRDDGLYHVDEAGLLEPPLVLAWLGQVTAKLAPRGAADLAPFLECRAVDAAVETQGLDGRVKDFQVAALVQVVVRLAEHRGHVVEARHHVAEIRIVEFAAVVPVLLLDVVLDKGAVGHTLAWLNSAQIASNDRAVGMLGGWCAQLQSQFWNMQKMGRKKSSALKMAQSLCLVLRGQGRLTIFQGPDAGAGADIDDILWVLYRCKPQLSLLDEAYHAVLMIYRHSLSLVDATLKDPQRQV